MKRIVLMLAMALGVAGLITASPANAATATCSRPTPTVPADALYIISNQSPQQSQAYWWSKTNLTISIETAPTTDPDQLAAVRRAIATWQQTLTDCLGGKVTLTYLPPTPGRRSHADITVHLVEHAGGNGFSGRAECGPSGCNNVIVSYSSPPGTPPPSGNPVAPVWWTEGVALHEIGHALGLGHATNLEESTDLMGYGWSSVNSGVVPAISQCDVDALAYVWSWALDGTPPARPAEAVFACT